MYIQGLDFWKNFIVYMYNMLWITCVGCDCSGECLATFSLLFGTEMLLDQVK